MTGSVAATNKQKWLLLSCLLPLSSTTTLITVAAVTPSTPSTPSFQRFFSRTVHLQTQLPVLAFFSFILSYGLIIFVEEYPGDNPLEPNPHRSLGITVSSPISVLYSYLLCSPPLFSCCASRSRLQEKFALTSSRMAHLDHARML